MYAIQHDNGLFYGMVLTTPTTLPAWQTDKIRYFDSIAAADDWRAKHLFLSEYFVSSIVQIRIDRLADGGMMVVACELV